MSTESLPYGYHLFPHNYWADGYFPLIWGGLSVTPGRPFGKDCNAEGNTNYYIKDPHARLDYSIDWVDWLGDDVIDSSTWILPDDLTSNEDSNVDGVATAWISGGIAGTWYTVTNRIVSTAGRQNDRSLYIEVVER